MPEIPADGCVQPLPFSRCRLCGLSSQRSESCLRQGRRDRRLRSPFSLLITFYVVQLNPRQTASSERGSCPLRDLHCCVRHSRGSMSRSPKINTSPPLQSTAGSLSSLYHSCLLLVPRPWAVASISFPAAATGQGRDSCRSFVEFNARQGKWIAQSFVLLRKRETGHGRMHVSCSQILYCDSLLFCSLIRGK